jgi:hypothetical protein
MAKIKAKAKNLSPEETREILTPFAFKIDQSLFGISLAMPWRRGVALLIDLCFIAILSEAPGELLAILVAITLFRLGGKKRAEKFGKKPGLRKSLMRLVGAFVVFVVLVDTLPELFSKMDDFNNSVEQAGQSENVSSLKKNKKNNDTNNSFIKGTLTVASTLAISQSECSNYQCWQQLALDLFNAYAEQAPTSEESEEFINTLLMEIANKATLSTQENIKLTTMLKQEREHKELKAAKVLNVASLELVEELENENAANLKALKELTPMKDSSEESSSVYKGFAWLQGLIEDLGIGFGWAAFYFTMFTAIWYGQTPGKKLLRIRVIQLDGTQLSVWDSFGRYGGYGAGIATGLLGFAQIYWDPNRQAIHDKISATIVINDTDTAREQMLPPESQLKTDELMQDKNDA